MTRAQLVARLAVRGWWHRVEPETQAAALDFLGANPALWRDPHELERAAFYYALGYGKARSVAALAERTRVDAGQRVGSCCRACDNP